MRDTARTEIGFGDYRVENDDNKASDLGNQEDNSGTGEVKRNQVY